MNPPAPCGHSGNNLYFCKRPLKPLPLWTTLSDFADKACPLPNYFGDLIKKETGKTAQEYIQNRLIDTAKAK